MNGPTAATRLAGNRAFRALWVSQFLSVTGARAGRLAYPLLVVSLGGSPADISIVSAAMTLPIPLLFLPAGAIVDRVSPRTILLFCEVLRGVALVSVVALLLTDGLTVAHLAAVAFVEGACFVSFQIAESAVLPAVVASDQLPTAVAANQARTSAAELIGQPLGGLMFGVARAFPFLANAVACSISFVLLLGLPRPRTEDASDEDGGARPFFGEVVEGLRWFARQRTLILLAGLTCMVNLTFAALPLLMIVRVTGAGWSSTTIGFMFATVSVGAVVGAFFAPRLARTLRPRVVVAGAFVMWTVGIAGMSSVEHPIALGAVLAVAMTLAPVFNVEMATYWYAITPSEMYGRSQSVLSLLSWISMPLGSLVAGQLATVTTPGSAFLLLAGVVGLVALVVIGVAVRGGLDAMERP